MKRISREETNRGVVCERRMQGDRNTAQGVISLQGSLVEAQGRQPGQWRRGGEGQGRVVAAAELNLGRPCPK